MKSVGQVVGLGGVEHPVVPRDGYLLGAEFAGVRVAVGDLYWLPEDDEGGVLASADLAAELGDLAVGPPVPRSVAFFGSGHAEQEHVHTAVRLTGGHRRGPPIPGFPGFLPGDRAPLQCGHHSVGDQPVDAVAHAAPPPASRAVSSALVAAGRCGLLGLARRAGVA
jgi:hypothetical protein